MPITLPENLDGFPKLCEDYSGTGDKLWKTIPKEHVAHHVLMLTGSFQTFNNAIGS